MILSNINRLRVELSIFLICTFSSGLIYFFSSINFNDVKTSFQNTRVKLLKSKTSFYRTSTQKSILEKYEDRYKTINKQYFLASENRFNWIDEITNIKNKYKIPKLKYKISPREKLSSASLTKQYPGIHLYQSSISLNMVLLHEGDLYSILNSIYNTDIGLFNVEECTLILNTKTKPIRLNEKNNSISAICKLNWYTLEIIPSVLHKEQNT